MKRWSVLLALVGAVGVAWAGDWSSARSHVNDHYSELERLRDPRQARALISSHSDFARKRVETRVDCYKQCPEIDSELRIRETSPSWREG